MSLELSPQAGLKLVQHNHRCKTNWVCAYKTECIEKEARKMLLVCTWLLSCNSSQPELQWAKCLSKGKGVLGKVAIWQGETACRIQERWGFLKKEVLMFKHEFVYCHMTSYLLCFHWKKSGQLRSLHPKRSLVHFRVLLCNLEQSVCTI